MKFQLLNKEAKYPTRGTPHSVGHDIYCTHGGVIPARGSKIFSTGLTLTIPGDEAMCLRSRSGLGFGSDITAFHGTIDADYFPNEIKVKMFNNTDEDFAIEKGQKIVQALFVKVETDDHCPIEKDERTGGFGHTDEESV